MSLAAAAIFTAVVRTVSAQTCTTQQSCSDLINEYQAKIDSLQNQAKTLNNQIAQFNYQITLTGLQIQRTQEKINELGGRIGQLEESLNDLSKAFSSRAVEVYKMSRLESNLAFLLSSDGLTDAVSRFYYLEKIQEEDRSLLTKLQEAQTTYKGEKVDQETLQAQLKTQEQNLTNQKAAKARLLKDTQNSEIKYQELLSEARAEFEAIQNVLAGKGQETRVGHVNQGDRIATIIQGSSCNSGGSHVQLTISQNGVALNPFTYLKSGVDFVNCSGSSCGSSDGDPFNPTGSWDWPISPQIRFNQGYGYTWAIKNGYVGKIYSFHNGIDINSTNPDVRAVKSGDLFRGSYTGQSGCQLRYVRVRNDEGGLDVFYLHVNYVL